MDRIDLQIEVPPVEVADLQGKGDANVETVETSEQVRERVAACRQRQLARQGRLNGELSPKQLQTQVVLSEPMQQFLQQAMNRLGLSARAYHAILRVALTLADMESADLQLKHLAEAVGYRNLDRLKA